MRGAALVSVLILPALAGCLSATDVDPASGPTQTLTPADLTDVPQGAEVAETAEGLVLEWTDVELPLEEEIAIPEGVTLVRAKADVGAGNGLFVDLEHDETGRRRCNTPYIAGWQQATRGKMTCSGLTAVDDLPTDWTVTVASGAVETADLVQVELRTAPVDGVAGRLDLDELSKPTRDLREVQSTRITSFDGTELYAEVTLPTGEGPWPVIISSSPYNSGYHAAGEPAMWEYFTKDWAKRGYAIVNVDVRGTGRSDGCMEVWGPNEQQDQVAVVEWAADQAWSDGRVALYGQSYVGTTPVEAAVQAPDALKAIVTVAPVNDAYRDWHFGGVPNGENVGSPVFYQSSTGGASDLETSDPVRSAIQVANGVCDPTLAARANDPRGIYDGFYEVRNFSARADEIEAAVMYTHGYEDPNVKSEMARWFFNAIDAPKLGLFGHWTHQHPPRADAEALMVGWMDQHLKGRDLGFDRLPNAVIRSGDGTERYADQWPPTDAPEHVYHASLGNGTLQHAPADGSASLTLVPTGQVPTPGQQAQVTLTGELTHDMHLAGNARVRLKATLENGGNAHVAAFLHDDSEDPPRLVTWGMVNLAHQDGHRSYEPLEPGETVTKSLPLLATEHVFHEGDEIRLVLRGAHAQDWFGVDPGPPGRLMLHGGEDGTALINAKAPTEAVPLPVSGMP